MPSRGTVSRSTPQRSCNSLPPSAMASTSAALPRLSSRTRSPTEGIQPLGCWFATTLRWVASSNFSRWPAVRASSPPASPCRNRRISCRTSFWPSRIEPTNWLRACPCCSSLICCCCSQRCCNSSCSSSARISSAAASSAASCCRCRCASRPLITLFTVLVPWFSKRVAAACNTASGKPKRRATARALLRPGIPQSNR